MKRYAAGLLGASGAVLLAGCAARSPAGPNSPDSLRYALFSPVSQVAWPRQLKNDLLVHVVDAARRAALTCSEHAARLQADADRANVASRSFGLASAIAGLGSAGLLGVGPVLYQGDQNGGSRESYTLVVGAAGTFITGTLAAAAAFTNGDERAKQDSKRVGEIQDAIEGFLAAWNSVLKDSAFDPYKQSPAPATTTCAQCTLPREDCPTQLYEPSREHPNLFNDDPDSSKGIVPEETPHGVIWKNGRLPYAMYLTEARCVLPNSKALELQVRLMTEVNQLAATCSKPSSQ